MTRNLLFSIFGVLVIGCRTVFATNNILDGYRVQLCNEATIGCYAVRNTGYLVSILDRAIAPADAVPVRFSACMGCSHNTLCPFNFKNSNDDARECKPVHGCYVARIKSCHVIMHINSYPDYTSKLEYLRAIASSDDLQLVKLKCDKSCEGLENMVIYDLPCSGDGEYEALINASCEQQTICTRRRVNGRYEHKVHHSEQALALDNCLNSGTYQACSPFFCHNH